MCDESPTSQGDQLRIIKTDLRLELVQADSKKRVAFDDVEASAPEFDPSASRQLRAGLRFTGDLDLLEALPSCVRRKRRRHRQTDDCQHYNEELAPRTQPAQESKYAKRQQSSTGLRNNHREDKNRSTGSSNPPPGHARVIPHQVKGKRDRHYDRKRLVV